METSMPAAKPHHEKQGTLNQKNDGPAETQAGWRAVPITPMRRMANTSMVRFIWGVNEGAPRAAPRADRRIEYTDGYVAPFHNVLAEDGEKKTT